MSIFTHMKYKFPLSGRRISFGLVVVLPSFLGVLYFILIASPQYVSEFGFSVKQQALTKMSNSSVSESLSGGNPLLMGAMNSEIVISYIKSHQILDDVRNKIDLEKIYNSHHADFVARLGGNVDDNDKMRYWRRMVDPFFDMTSGLVNVKVKAFSADDAQHVAKVVLSLSEALVNRMSIRARADKLHYAEISVQQKQKALIGIEKELSDYRNAHRFLFPNLSASANSSLESQLGLQEAQTQAHLATLLAQGASSTSPQISVLRNKIHALEKERTELQGEITSPFLSKAIAETSPKSLATVLADYQILVSNERLAEKALDLALQSRQMANDQAVQQQIYLETFIEPNLPDSALYPQRLLDICEVVLISFFLWCIGALIYYGVREHLD